MYALVWRSLPGPLAVRTVLMVAGVIAGVALLLAVLPLVHSALLAGSDGLGLSDPGLQQQLLQEQGGGDLVPDVDGFAAVLTQ